MIRVVKVNNLRTPEQRAGVCYIGRRFAGWPASLWRNPFRVNVYFNATPESRAAALAECLSRFRRYAEGQSEAWFQHLWLSCDRGDKPLGCYCIDATHGDGQAVVCHGQILAAMLAERFLKEGVDRG